MPIGTDGLKDILTTSGFGLNAQSSTSLLNGNELLYTYADADDKARPYGNLFKSFNFPTVIPDESNLFNSKYIGYALGNLNVRKIIVVEIPKGKYGELIDGKTFQLTIPVTLNGVASATTLYGTYFGYSGVNETSYIGSNLNSQLSEVNSYAKEFGLTPSTGNGYNSNVTFLYSNNIQKPKNPIAGNNIILDSGITLTSSINSRLTLTGVTLNPGDIIKVSVTRIDGLAISTDISFTINSQYLPIDDTYVTVQGSIIGSPIIWDNVPTTSNYDIKIIITKLETSELTWNSYSFTNKFPNIAASSNGKRYARYGGTSQDIPVGILYNDKGIAVITHPTLVSGFRYSAGTSSGYNGIASGSPYSGDTNFAKIYFGSSSLSQSTFNSITTEFVQNIMCIADLNEFNTTTNSTFLNSYDPNTTEQPVFITTIGLYNANKELIGIGKLSEPVKKTKSNIIPFSIKLVI